MKNSYKTLIVEDYVLIAKGLERILNEITESTGTTFEIHYASKCSQAIAILKDEPLVDLVFLDIKLPKEPEIGMLSGEDLGIEIRKSHPQAHIIVTTAYNEPIRIKSIYTNIKPDGFFVKGDINHNSITSAYEKALNEPPFYSRTAEQSLLSFIAIDFTLDQIDVQILIGLYKGLTMKEISNELFLSRAAIVKRKQKIKLQFEVENGKDRDLVNVARKLGFI